MRLYQIIGFGLIDVILIVLTIISIKIDRVPKTDEPQQNELRWE